MYNGLEMNNTREIHVLEHNTITKERYHIDNNGYLDSHFSSRLSECNL